MEKKHNIKKNYLAIALLITGTGLFNNVSAQTQQSNLATQLQRGGVTVINGYTGQTNGNGYRSQAAYQNYQNYQNQMNNRNTTQASPSQLPAASGEDAASNGNNGSSGIYTDPKNAQANSDMLDGVNKMTQDAKQALATLNQKAGIQDDNSSTPVNNNTGNNEKKKRATPSLKVTGPKVEKVGISAFNQNTIHEMEAYGKQREQSEYLKFRMMADSHKNKPIQIRTP